MSENEDERWSLYRVWVTDLGMCPRRIQLKYQGVDELPSHFYQIKGHIVHEAIESVLKNEPYEIEAEDDIKKEVEAPLNNFRKWLETTRYDIGGAQIELKLEMPMPLPHPNSEEYTLVGKLDLVTPDLIIDFKTGKKQKRKENIIQLTSYKILAEYNNVARNPRLVNVFLGGKEPKELEYSVEEIKKAEAEFYDLVHEHVGILEAVKQGMKMPCKISFKCVYCPFLHVCRGI